MAEVLDIVRINKAVCKALDLDPARVQSIQMDFSSSGISLVVKQFVGTAQGERLATELAEFTLVPKT